MELNVQIHYIAKSGPTRPPLFAAMQSLYEKDKMFALQYIIAAAENDTYRTPLEDE